MCISINRTADNIFWWAFLVKISKIRMSKNGIFPQIRSSKLCAREGPAPTNQYLDIYPVQRESQWNCNGNYNGGWRRDIRGGQIHKQHGFSRDFFNLTGTTKVFKIKN